MKSYIPEAHSRQNGKTVTVQHSGTKRKPGNVYYEEALHRRWLACQFCGAAEKPLKGRFSSLGSVGPGAQPSFTPVRRHNHDCKLAVKNASRPRRRRIKVDRAKGPLFRVNIHQPSEIFDDPSAVKEMKDGVEVKDREVIIIEKAEDFIHPMETMPYRLKDGKVTYRELRGWEDFFIPYPRGRKFPDRYEALLRRLQKMGEGAELLCLMEIRIAKGHDYANKPTRPLIDAWKKVSPAPLLESEPIHFYNTRGIAEDIYPKIKLEHFKSQALNAAFSKPGTYFVLAPVSLRTVGKRKNLHQLILRLNHHEQVVKVDFSEIMKKAKLAMSRHAQRARKAAMVPRIPLT